MSRELSCWSKRLRREGYNPEDSLIGVACVFKKKKKSVNHECVCVTCFHVVSPQTCRGTAPWKSAGTAEEPRLDKTTRELASTRMFSFFSSFSWRYISHRGIEMSYQSCHVCSMSCVMCHIHAPQFETIKSVRLFISLSAFPLKDFHCKTSPGFRNGWTTWSGRSGPQVDISTCAASILQKTALIYDGASATWRTQPSPLFSLPVKRYVYDLFVFFSRHPSVPVWRSSETSLCKHSLQAEDVHLCLEKSFWCATSLIVSSELQEISCPSQFHYKHVTCFYLHAEYCHLTKTCFLFISGWWEKRCSH